MSESQPFSCCDFSCLPHSVMHYWCSVLCGAKIYLGVIALNNNTSCKTAVIAFCSSGQGGYSIQACHSCRKCWSDLLYSRSLFADQFVSFCLFCFLLPLIRMNFTVKNLYYDLHTCVLLLVQVMYIKDETQFQQCALCEHGSFVCVHMWYIHVHSYF